MNRSIQKAIEDYQKIFRKGNSNRGAFFVSDFIQIVKITEDSPYCDKYGYINNAAMAAFMIGYRTAKREEAEKRKRAKLPFNGTEGNNV